MTEQPPPPGRQVSGAQVLLGIFVLWQIFFLAGGNLIELADSARDDLPKDVAPAVEQVVPGWPEKKGHVHDLTELAGKATTRWGQVTGQLQGWQLFAPDIRRHSVFPAVVLRWDDDPRWPLPLPAPQLAARRLAPLAARTALELAVLRLAAVENVPPPPAPFPSATLLSDNEPPDVNSYFRFGRFRLRRLEGNLTVLLRQATDETPAQAAERWRGRIFELLDHDGEFAKAYLQWRWQSYRREHPDRPEPKQIILVMRRYAIADPEKAPPYWEGPFTVPVARLQPPARGEASRSALEMYNPVTQRFQEIHK